MQLIFTSHRSLPKLAWLATVDCRAGTAHVRHGSAVEVREKFFIEGTRNGDFEAGDLASTECVRQRRGDSRRDAALVTSCSTTDGLFVSKGWNVFVSNSLPFLLAAVTDELDPTLLDISRSQRVHSERHQRYERDRRLFTGEATHPFVRNLEVSRFHCREVDKPLPPRFPAFEDYCSDPGQQLVS